MQKPGEQKRVNVTIDPMRVPDWGEVRAIYLEGIATGNATFETDVPSWESWDAAHLPECRLVARMDAGTVGWAALGPVSRRRVYAGVAEVSVYVAEAARRRGVGHALLAAIIICGGRRQPGRRIPREARGCAITWAGSRDERSARVGPFLLSPPGTTGI